MSQPHSARTARSQAWMWAVAASSLVLAIVALVLSQVTPLNWVIADPTATETPCPTATPTPTPTNGSDNSITIAAAHGLSAYELWLSVGNTGTVNQFLQSLVGEPGPAGADGETRYVGNDGQSGPAGESGASAYQLWLDVGNAGTEQDFLDSLVGTAGADGVDGVEGPSAYDLWVLTGNDGTIDDFLDSLVGVQGVAGEQGPAGQCVIGPQGEQGATGEAGAPGIAGLDGLSAYDVWVLNGGQGTAADFLTALIGERGPQGDAGPAGPAGATGASGFGDIGAFYDLTIQGSSGSVSTAVNTAHPVYLGQTDADSTHNVSVEHGAGDADGRASHITFTTPGVYNIAFSGQIYRTAGGSAAHTSFWLRRNGSNVPASNTDFSVQSNSTKLVAAWNFVVPVVCDPECDTYQIMWSFDSDHTNLWYQAEQSNPVRPEIPSVILTVNQIR